MSWSNIIRQRDEAEQKMLRDAGYEQPEITGERRITRDQPSKRKGRSSVARRREMMRAVFRLDWQEMTPADVVRSGANDAKTKRLAIVGCACEACKVAMPAPALVHLHHVVFVARGGTNDDDNVALLCPNCHAKAHWLDRKLPADERPQDRAALLALLAVA